MSQSQAILHHLREGRVCSALDSLRLFSCLRLAARIGELREQGWPIQTRRVLTRTHKRIAVYWLPPGSRRRRA